MALELYLHPVTIGKTSVSIFVPDPISIRDQYQTQKEVSPQLDFPYWSQLWPASIGLATFLEERPYYITNKRLLEIGAGLGLPSLIAARYAKKICASDYLPEVLECLQASATHNKLENFTSQLIDWNKLEEIPKADVLLISDINYDPKEFPAILALIEKFLDQQTTVILSTPQRLMARSFLNSLEVFCIEKEVIQVESLGENIPISVWVLQNRRASGNSWL